jgi:hypothetical protein
LDSAYLFADMRNITLLILTASVLQAADDLSVLYTGRLLGHFRYPEVQEPNAATKCPDIVKEPIQGHAAELRSMILQARKSRPLLGVGDSFAPQLEARTFQQKGGVRIGKENLMWTGSSWVPADRAASLAATTVGMDNVACFMKLVGYTAVVPGKHDFYFGAARLQQLAAFLETGQEGYSTVTMLGANLAVQVKDATARPALADWQKRP